MGATEHFNGLHGKDGVTREHVQCILDLAKAEENGAIVYRLSQLLEKNPKDKIFRVEVAKYSKKGLTGPQHKGAYKEALDSCGRLKPGFKFEHGTLIDVRPKKAPVKPKVAKKIVSAKEVKTVATPVKKAAKKVAVKKTIAPAVKVATKKGMTKAQFLKLLKATSFKEYTTKLDFIKGYVEFEKRIEGYQVKREKALNYEKHEEADLLETAIEKEMRGMHLQVEQGAKYFKITDSDFLTVMDLYAEDATALKKAMLPTNAPAKTFPAKENPKGFANKPKSVSVASAIKEVLATGKYPGIKEMQVNVLLTVLQGIEDIEAEDIPIITTIFQENILKGISGKYVYFDWDYLTTPEITLYDRGQKLISAVRGRIESLKNQKHNLAMFDGLKGAKPAKKMQGLNGCEAVEENPVQVEALEEIKQPEPVKVPQIKKDSRVQQIGSDGNDEPSEFFVVAGETGKFLQQVERKPFESVVITLDGEQGAGKTTALYKFMQDFAEPGNRCLYISGEEHPSSSLAKDKAAKYLTPEAKANIDTIDKVNDTPDLYSLVEDYEIIFIDSWQKLQRMVGSIRLDEDLRKKFDGKVFVIIFQQTTEGRTKGGAEVVFDGDIIIKMVKEASFADNYAFFDKNRYTLIPIEDIRYNIASGKTYNPNVPVKEDNPVMQLNQDKPALLFKVV